MAREKLTISESNEIRRLEDKLREIEKDKKILQLEKQDLLESNSKLKENVEQLKGKSLQMPPPSSDYLHQLELEVDRMKNGRDEAVMKQRHLVAVIQQITSIIKSVSEPKKQDQKEDADPEKAPQEAPEAPQRISILKSPFVQQLFTSATVGSIASVLVLAIWVYVVMPSK